MTKIQRDCLTIETKAPKILTEQQIVSPAAPKSFLHGIRHCCVDGDTSDVVNTPVMRGDVTEQRGIEIDKWNQSAIRNWWDNYLFALILGAKS